VLGGCDEVRTDGPRHGTLLTKVRAESTDERKDHVSNVSRLVAASDTAMELPVHVLTEPVLNPGGLPQYRILAADATGVAAAGGVTGNQERRAGIWGRKMGELHEQGGARPVHQTRLHVECLRGKVVESPRWSQWDGINRGDRSAGNDSPETGLVA